ncbi:MAG: DUF3822 family protein [Chitinophagales bacterium]
MDIALRKSIVEGTPYVSKLFREQQPLQLMLKIFLSPNQLQFLITDEHHTVLWLQPYECTENNLSFLDDDLLDELTVSNELLEKKFVTVSAGIFTSEFILAPELEASAEMKNFFRKQSVSPDEESEILQDQIHELSAELIYAVPSPVMKALAKMFETFSYQHACAAQIRHLLPKNLGWNVYVVIQNGPFQILVFSGHQLKFANSFSFRTAEDFIYYIMAVYHSLELDPENIPVTVFGEILRDSALFQIMTKYIRDVKLGKAPELWKFEDDYPFPLHFYSSLLTL